MDINSETALRERRDKLISDLAFSGSAERPARPLSDNRRNLHSAQATWWPRTNSCNHLSSASSWRCSSAMHEGVPVALRFRLFFHGRAALQFLHTRRARDDKSD